VQVQALAVQTLISNWMTVYEALNTTGLYQWNHFAIEAASIEARAKMQGITDEILFECAAFAIALKKAKGFTAMSESPLHELAARCDLCREDVREKLATFDHRLLALEIVVRGEEGLIG